MSINCVSTTLDLELYLRLIVTVGLNDLQSWLQAEITAMAPQVAFYEHRRAILNMDNNTIKQKMAAIVQGQLFKDGM